MRTATGFVLSTLKQATTVFAAYMRQRRLVDVLGMPKSTMQCSIWSCRLLSYAFTTSRKHPTKFRHSFRATYAVWLSTNTLSTKAAVVPEPVSHLRQNAIICSPCAHPGFENLHEEAVQQAGDREWPLVL